MLLNLISFLANIILSCLGWSWFDNDTLDQLTRYDRAVLILSHTAYIDFFFLMMYLLSSPHRLSHVRFLMKPQPFQYFGPLLTYLGAIPSTRLQDKNGGSVNRIVSEVAHSDRFLFVMSPKGTIMKRDWRSGYYHIANQLQVHLMVVGLDYEKKCLIVSDAIESTNDESTIRSFLYQRLSMIVPLFPDREVVEIRPHVCSKRGRVNRICVLLTMLSFILTYGIYMRS